jgi:dTDP-4-dehydrorhamnose 3,5-epimerase
MGTMIDGVLITTLKVIDVTGGDVLHAMKSADNGYEGFGEAYFSIIKKGIVKCWKLHKEMTLNLVVPEGSVRFILFDERKGSSTFGDFQEVVLSRENYRRLTVPPMVWLGFQGMGEKDSMLLNIANIPHNPNEMLYKKISEIDFDWEVK